MFEESFLFTMNEKEEETTRYWIEEHNKTCELYDKNLYTYCFTPTALGTGIEVRCSCGEVMNVSNTW